MIVSLKYLYFIIPYLFQVFCCFFNIFEKYYYHLLFFISNVEKNSTDILLRSTRVPIRFTDLLIKL